ncbi:DUF1826 domain-containing protein [Alteromonas sp. ALT199]|uniref:DUF1826 domain-containing protein n=1 Tax=unclassified Alteromonas TaxID=2614992 RepID=UPI001BEB1AE3|nr:DUF1826 domain-containing protein [Alteromonas sp. ALT199]MBT3133536.1 DUF1826 domain-containing protein [Alteromonas sp. ALT199]
MQVLQDHNTIFEHTNSWRSSVDAMVLGDIFDEGISVAVWNRPEAPLISQYYSEVFKSLGMGIRGVFSMASLREEIATLLPNAQSNVGKQAAIDDIYLLSDMLTTLFDCDSVGVRLVPLSSAMCPSFHVDNIPVRLVNTYLGEGTEWLPIESVVTSPMIGLGGENAHGLSKNRLGQCYQESSVRQMNAFDVGLLKGKSWQGHEEFAAVHRSCRVQPNTQRVLLTLDPM